MSFADFMHAFMGYLGVTRDYQALGPFWGAIFGAMLTAGGQTLKKGPKMGPSIFSRPQFFDASMGSNGEGSCRIE